ncbi:uncharacterized protein [Periplaneta americana]|uniref:uncharacterized protein n=1 Tax=Periplaneta americana TaxID=6978 RepID=UPI0037E6FC52
MSPSPKENQTHKLNKKEWRQRKYNNKYKVEKWEEGRRKAILHNYYKELRKGEGFSFDRRKQMTKQSLDGNRNRISSRSAFQEAQEEYKRKMEERIAELKEAQRKKEERSQALARYGAVKAEVYKKLSRKTKKGQPVMKGRIELLLTKLHRDLKS